MFPSCKQCGSRTRPATVDEAVIFGGIGMIPGMMTWKCPNCGGSFVRPLERHQIEEVRHHLKQYDKRSKKRWWQFWK